MNPDLNKLDQSSWFIIICKTAFLFYLCFLAFQLIFTQNPYTPLDWADVLIHESGHALFLFAGQTIMTLGGTILQLLVPFFISLYFLFRKSFFSSAFGLFWLGNALVHTSRYIKDAQARELPTIPDGGIHDWWWLLDICVLLQNDQIIGGAFFLLACLILLCSIGLFVMLIYLDILKKLSPKMENFT